MSSEINDDEDETIPVLEDKVLEEEGESLKYSDLSLEELKQLQEAAIADEDYEKAARLRDEIDKRLH